MSTDPRRAADSADNMVKDTRAIGQAQVRAYIVCKSAEFAIKKNCIDILIELENIGHSPAINVVAKGNIFLWHTEGSKVSSRDSAFARSEVEEIDFEPVTLSATKTEALSFTWGSNFVSGDGSVDIPKKLDDANEIGVAVAVIWNDVFGVTHRIDLRMLGYLGPGPHTKIRNRKNKGSLKMRVTKDWLEDKGYDEN